MVAAEDQGKPSGRWRCLTLVLDLLFSIAWEHVLWGARAREPSLRLAHEEKLKSQERVGHLHLVLSTTSMLGGVAALPYSDNGAHVHHVHSQNRDEAASPMYTTYALVQHLNTNGTRQHHGHAGRGRSAPVQPLQGDGGGRGAAGGGQAGAPACV